MHPLRQRDEESGIYRFADVDLDGDGNAERLQLGHGRHGCGATGGCTLSILADRDGSWEEIGTMPLVWAPVTVLESESDGWREIGFRARFDAFVSWEGLIRRENGAFRTVQTDEEYDWEKPPTGSLLFDEVRFPDEDGQDIRPILREQGFYAPLNGREQIHYAGEIPLGVNSYQIYSYFGRHLPHPGGVDHGVSKIIVIQNETTFLGQYHITGPVECWVSNQAVECATSSPGNLIQFNDEGPPEEIWQDGEVLQFERAELTPVNVASRPPR